MGKKKKSKTLDGMIDEGYKFRMRPGTTIVDVLNPAEDGTDYIVDLAYPGSCDCPAWKHDCKHLKGCFKLSKGGLFNGGR